MWPGEGARPGEPIRAVGFVVRRRRPCSRDEPVKRRKLARARSRVRTLPARTPPEVARPLATVTVSEPRRYSPSGMPVALMASVTRRPRWGPLQRDQMRTISGVVWMPSQMSSA